MRGFSIIFEKFTFREIDNLIKELCKNIGCLYSLAEIISNLDLIYSLALHAIISKDYSRPKFNQHYLDIVNCRHPIVEIVKNDFVPNSIV